MNYKNDGGPAFPDQGQRKETNGTWNQQWSPGMSLRDWFAGMALQGLLAAEAHPRSIGTTYELQEQIPEHAYKFADAMIAERNNQTTEEAQ